LFSLLIDAHADGMRLSCSRYFSNILENLSNFSGASPRSMGRMDFMATSHPPRPCAQHGPRQLDQVPIAEVARGLPRPSGGEALEYGFVAFVLDPAQCGGDDAIAGGLAPVVPGTFDVVNEFMNSVEFNDTICAPESLSIG